MIPTELLEYGVAVAAIGGMVYIVKKSLCFMKRQEENFTKIITNHLHDNAIANQKLEQSHLQLSMMIKELLSFLKRSNGK